MEIHIDIYRLTCIYIYIDVWVYIFLFWNFPTHHILKEKTNELNDKFNMKLDQLYYQNTENHEFSMVRNKDMNKPFHTNI